MTADGATRELSKPDEPSASLRVTNDFNGETFIFPAAYREGVEAMFDLILREGGTGGGNALVHSHPQADETFTVREGRLKIVMAGRDYYVESGQTLTIPRGTPHYFANGGRGAMRASLTFSPAQQHSNFFRNFALLAEQRREWFSDRGDPKLLLVALVLHTYRDHLRLAGPPAWLQKGVFAVLARLARWRGYRLAVLPDGSPG